VKRLLGCVLLASALIPVPSPGASPVVSNITVAQRRDGSRLVDIRYDLTDAEGDTATVSVQAAAPGDSTWFFPCRALSGDVGPGIPPGAGRHIVWDLAADGIRLELADLRVRLIVSDQGVSFPAHSPYRIAVLDWQAIDWNSAATYERLGRADLLVLTASNLWGVPAAEQLGIIARLKAVNPGIKILAYVLAKTSMIAWEHTSASFAHRWWQRTRPFWSYTTTGDTLSDWPGQVVVNILDPGCRQAIIDLIVEYQRQSPIHFDGVFWDYFNSGGVWIPSSVDVAGEPDLDGDGIPTDQDQDERQAYDDACTNMVTALRDSLGPSFLQILNGQRAYRDSAFAALGDGMNYELFPYLFFPQDANMGRALDPSYPYNLFRVSRWPRRSESGPYLILENIHDAVYIDDATVLRTLEYGDLFRVVSLLVDDVIPVWGGHGEDWPANDFSLGAPLGPTVIEGNRYSRNFRYGRLEVEMTTGMMPNPFRYTIRCNGKIVESLDVPHHFP